MDIKTKMGHEGVPYLNDIGTVLLCSFLSGKPTKYAGLA